MVSLKSIAGKLFANNKEVALVDDGAGITNGGDSSSGYWTKFPDGTMIAHHRDGPFPMNQGITRDSTWAVPGSPVSGTITATVAKDGDTLDTVWGAETGISTWKSISVFMRNSTNSGGNCMVNYTFIGRWE